MLPLLPDGTMDELVKVAAEGSLGKMPRSEQEFEVAAQHGKGEWFGCAEKIAGALEGLSDADGRVREWMDRNRHDRHLGKVVLQMEEQRAWLLRAGFAWKAGYDRMKRYQRFFHGMEERISRLDTQPLLRDEEIS